MAKGFLANLKGVDAFGKTTDDVKIKTRTGAFLTLVSAAIILSFTLMEFIDYRRIYTDTSLLVDRSRGEKLSMRMNVTFPRVPCYLVSVDVMDISGETQRDITHSIRKARLDSSGKEIRGSRSTSLKNEVEKYTEDQSADYCGSCYGGLEPANGCCNTCEEVRTAYINKGWSFSNPDSIEQCKKEGWADKLKEQANEGCNVVGRVRVNKVAGNIHLSPGRSFRSSSRDVYELVPYLRDDGSKHDYSHTIHELTFESQHPLSVLFGLLLISAASLYYFTSLDDDDYNFRKSRVTKEMRKRLGLDDPLKGTTRTTNKPRYMYQYFLKVVSTHFRTIDGQLLKSHQYSATHFERDIAEGGQGDTPQGVYLQHGVSGVPGVFFNFEISPILVVHTDTRQSFAHFVTSTCAIIGGVLTVASLFDSMLFATTRALKKH
ncbi:endoplasmic reticulum vesicle transporter-domain-containing protein [Lentinula aciculospora]|uniref:Endoplasmic reticulum vesicle transporter-domain-containing protein n=1 Tax=Lentinula aciculospora TaxID=153920 RepID=A0A9W9AG91_9AGAR|nr:endoplasmic reticulum vesicle transporter-domain-containing protein [Lentinula aciculospora]